MSDARQREDERIIFRANELLGKHEKLRGRAIADLIGAAVRMTVRASSACAPAEDEQYERNDGKDDEDRPQHDGESTRPVVVENMHFGPTVELTDEPAIVLDGRSYRVVTPEIQAVLDALPQIIDDINRAGFNHTGWVDLADLMPAWQAYLASIEPPKPTVVIDRPYSFGDHDVELLMSDGSHIRINISDPENPITTERTTP